MQCENRCWRSPVTPARSRPETSSATRTRSPLLLPSRNRHDSRSSVCLIKHEPIGITAGVIADTIGAPHNTLSTHLAILVRAGLLRSSREGRTIIYRSDVEGMQSLLSFLVNDCCDGHPELCNLLLAAPTLPGAAPRFHPKASLGESRSVRASRSAPDKPARPSLRTVMPCHQTT